MAVTSVVLRFRDLGIDPGETIKRHLDVIESHEGVWWGWWAQGNETVPTAAYKALHKTAESASGLDIFLFDSGQLTSYRAHCTSVKWDPVRAMPSPDPGMTPAYYSERQCRAWWLFKSIEPVEFDEVRKFSYVDTPEHFEDGQTLNYSLFDGKQVRSPAELHEQRRTVWYVRPYRRDTDRDEEIILVSRSTVEPQDFYWNYLASTSNRLLWLSDLHFSLEDHHGFAVEGADVQRRTLSEAIRAAVAEHTPADTLFAGLIVSGDLTYRADPAEFDQGMDFLLQTADWAGIRPNLEQAIAIEPGNHDIRFSETPEKKDTPARLVGPEAREAYSNFYRALFHKPPNEYLCSGRRFLLGNSIPVDVAMLNSSLLEQSPAGATALFQGQGFVGDHQLDEVASRFSWGSTPPGKVIRIVVLHHHLLSGLYSQPAEHGANYSTVLDTGRLQRWLFKNRVDLVLHGHQHGWQVLALSQPHYSPTSGMAEAGRWPGLHVVGLGSAGVASTRRPQDMPNMFATLTFQRAAVTVDIWSISPAQPSSSVQHVVLELATE